MRKVDLPVARHVKLLLVLVFLDALNDRSIGDTHTLYQRRQIVHIEMSVWTSVSFAWTGRVLGEDLLATKGAITTTPAIRITTHIAVYVPNIVSVFLVERLVIDLAEAASPENQTLLEIKSDALEE